MCSLPRPNLRHVSNNFKFLQFFQPPFPQTLSNHQGHAVPQLPCSTCSLAWAFSRSENSHQRIIKTGIWKCCFHIYCYLCLLWLTYYLLGEFFCHPFIQQMYLLNAYYYLVMNWTSWTCPLLVFGDFYNFTGSLYFRHSFTKYRPS